jgi:hypothetical protein
MLAYPDTYAAMLRHAAHFALRIIGSYTGSLGTTLLGYFAPILVVLLAFVLSARAKAKVAGWTKVLNDAWKEWRKPAGIALLVVYGLIFSWAFVREAWKDHRDSVIEKADLKTKLEIATVTISQLNADLRLKTLVPHFRDPAFGIVAGGAQAFMKFRRAIGPDASCSILTTEPSNRIGPDIGDISYTIISVGVMGANCPNGNLRNIGVKDENIELLSHKDEIPGTVVLHALPETKGIITLQDDLSVLFPIKRSYTFPVPVTSSQNVIWLQFGPDMKWNSERHP